MSEVEEISRFKRLKKENVRKTLLKVKNEHKKMINEGNVAWEKKDRAAERVEGPPRASQLWDDNSEWIKGEKCVRKSIINPSEAPHKLSLSFNNRLLSILENDGKINKNSIKNEKNDKFSNKSLSGKMLGKLSVENDLELSLTSAIDNNNNQWEKHVLYDFKKINNERKIENDEENRQLRDKSVTESLAGIIDCVYSDNFISLMNDEERFLWQQKWGIIAGKRERNFKENGEQFGENLRENERIFRETGDQFMENAGENKRIFGEIGEQFDENGGKNESSFGENGEKYEEFHGENKRIFVENERKNKTILDENNEKFSGMRERTCGENEKKCGENGRKTEINFVENREIFKEKEEKNKRTFCENAEKWIENGGNSGRIFGENKQKCGLKSKKYFYESREKCIRKSERIFDNNEEVCEENRKKIVKVFDENREKYEGKVERNFVENEQKFGDKSEKMFWENQEKCKKNVKESEINLGENQDKCRESDGIAGLGYFGDLKVGLPIENENRKRLVFWEENGTVKHDLVFNAPEDLTENLRRNEIEGISEYVQDSATCGRKDRYECRTESRGACNLNGSLLLKNHFSEKDSAGDNKKRNEILENFIMKYSTLSKDNFQRLSLDSAKESDAQNLSLSQNCGEYNSLMVDESEIKCNSGDFRNGDNKNQKDLLNLFEIFSKRLSKVSIKFEVKFFVKHIAKRTIRELCNYEKQKRNRSITLERIEISKSTQEEEMFYLNDKKDENVTDILVIESKFYENTNRSDSDDPEAKNLCKNCKGIYFNANNTKSEYINPFTSLVHSLKENNIDRKPSMKNCATETSPLPFPEKEEDITNRFSGLLNCMSRQNQDLNCKMKRLDVKGKVKATSQSIIKRLFNRNKSKSKNNPIEHIPVYNSTTSSMLEKSTSSYDGTPNDLNYSNKSSPAPFKEIDKVKKNEWLEIEQPDEPIVYNNSADLVRRVSSCQETQKKFNKSYFPTLTSKLDQNIKGLTLINGPCAEITRNSGAVFIID